MPKSKAVPDEQAALLTAIIAHPADNAARLVYADWLQEHGDEEQAEFIRDSIKLSLMKPSGTIWKTLRDRLWELEKARRSAWLTPLGIESGRPDYKRGLAESLFYDDPEDYFREQEAIFRYLPIRHLGFGIGDGTGFTDEHLERLAQTPELARLKSLELHDHMDCKTKSWRDLFHSPHLDGLTYLRIVGCEFGDAEAEALASSPALKNLTELEFAGNEIGRDGCRALTDSPNLKNVRKLSMIENDFGDDEEFQEAAGLLEGRFGDKLDCTEAEEDAEDDA